MREEDGTNKNWLHYNNMNCNMVHSVLILGGAAACEAEEYSASSLVCHFSYTFYSNCGRFAWFMPPYSADLSEIY